MKSLQLLAAGVISLYSSAAFAHVDLASGPAVAGESQVLRFTVGHGCAGADTVRVEIRLPEEISSVRAVPSTFGGEGQVVESSTTGLPAAVVWSKPAARAGDDQFYELAIRAGVPETPFTALTFPVVQTCRAGDGTESTSEWTPVLHILPPRKPGWNKHTVPVAIADLSMFDDAEIVWMGNAAYSGNPTTMELIAGEPDVILLDEISAGAEIWVKY